MFSIVAIWRVSGGLELSCGGKNFLGRVEKKQNFWNFLVLSDISKIVAVWAKIVAVFREKNQIFLKLWRFGLKLWRFLGKKIGAAFGGFWLQKWRFLISKCWKHWNWILWCYASNYSSSFQNFSQKNDNIHTYNTYIVSIGWFFNAIKFLVYDLAQTLWYWWHTLLLYFLIQ